MWIIPLFVIVFFALVGGWATKQVQKQAAEEQRQARINEARVKIAANSHEPCPGCGVPFVRHTEQYEACISRVLAV